MLFSLANIGVELGLERANQFAFTDVGSGLAAHHFEDFDLERLGTILADCFTEGPVATFGQGASNVLLPAATKGLGGRAFLNVGHTDILKLAYGQAVDDVITINSGLSLHHGRSIQAESVGATKIDSHAS